jgi:fucose 4-O-acetylase-like acetyltransferase
MQLKVDDRVREEWNHRAGEVATVKLIQSLHARFIQIGSAVLICAWSLIPMATSASIWTSQSLVFRLCFTAIAMAIIIFGMIMPGRRRARWTKEAAICALNFLRETKYPRLTRLPYAVMRNSQAFDRFLASVPSN